MRRDVVASAVQVDPQHWSSRRRTITASANWAESSRRKQPSPSAKVKPRAPTEVETAGTSAAMRSRSFIRIPPPAWRGEPPRREPLPALVPDPERTQGPRSRLHRRVAGSPARHSGQRAANVRWGRPLGFAGILRIGTRSGHLDAEPAQVPSDRMIGSVGGWFRIGRIRGAGIGTSRVRLTPSWPRSAAS